jgi:hypothetical protein
MDLGPGTKIPVGDERAFLMKLSSPTERDRMYVPDSIVVHCVTGRGLTTTECLERCFFGGVAAGAIQRTYAEERYRTHEFGALIARTLFRSSSVFELACVTIRAVGVVAGKLNIYPIASL